MGYVVTEKQSILHELRVRVLIFEETRAVDMLIGFESFGCEDFLLALCGCGKLGEGVRGQQEKVLFFLRKGGCLQKAVFSFRAKRHLLELESYQMNPREKTKEGANLIACELIKCGPRGLVRDEIDKLKTAQRP
ncbi:hypothetical protein TNCV_947881 [Trichonephila clavipes]|nr:hypothetical protein TNCV_947881 [Trichonephila clavipes]